jgi:predicted RNase H-like HicB family nuclease
VRDYLVIYEQAEDGGWGAYIPDLPGVVALGESKGEVEESIKASVELYVEEVGEEGLPGQPTAAAGTISI